MPGSVCLGTEHDWARDRKGEVWDKRKAGLSSSPLPAGGTYIQPLFTCDSAAAVLKMNKLCGNDISIFVFLLQPHQRWDYVRKENLLVNMVSCRNQAFN